MSPRRAASCAGALVALLVAAPVGALPGDISSRFKINDDDPMANVPSLKERNEDPIEFAHYLQDLIARAEGAFVKKQWETSIKYYEVLASVVPERAIASSRLCIAYSELGKLDQAIQRCGRTLELAGARVFDHLRFIDVVLRKPALTPADVAEVDASLAHLRAHASAHPQPASPSAGASSTPTPAANPSVKRTPKEILEDFKRKREARLLAQLNAPEDKKPEVTLNLPLEIEVSSCRLGVRLKDAARLKPCIAGLHSLRAPEKLVLPFEWAEALTRQDAARATALLAAARKAGFPEAALKAMADEQEKTLSEGSVLGQLLRWGPFGGIALVLLTLLALFVSKRTRATPGVRRSELASAGGASTGRA